MAVSGRKLSSLTESVLKGSAEDFDHKCDLCLTEDQHVEAHGFCVDCQEYLCQSCFKFHQKTTALKNHELLDKDNMTKGKTSATETTSEVLTEICSTHKNEVIKFFCPKHETLGCTDCITMDHRTCKIDYIPEVCAGVGNSKEYMYILSKLEQKMDEVDVVMKKAEKRGKEIDIQYESVLNEIVKFRKEINDRLDKLQKNINESANKKRSQDKKVVKDAQDASSSLSSDFKKLQSNLQDSKSSNQNGQLYITMKQAKTKLKSNAIEQVDKSLEEVTVQYKFDRSKQLEKMLLKEDVFGEVKYKADAPRSSKVDHSKYLTYIDDVNIRTESDKAFFKCNVIGCTAVGNNKIVLIDSSHNQKLKVVDTENKIVVEEKILDPTPYGITSLPNDQIAVTIPKKKEILIMTAAPKISFIRRIRLKEECYNVTYYQGQLYVICRGPDSIIIADMQGKVLDKLPLKNEGLGNVTSIACSKNADLLYIAYSQSNQILGVALNGEVSAVYEDETLRGPQAMAVVDDGSLVVCSNAFHTIHRITGDLKEGQQIDVDVTQTYSICYSRQQKRVYTGSFSSDLLKVFSLK